MTKETMTVHEALAEIKKLDSLIPDRIAGAKFVATKIKSAVNVSGVSRDDCCRQIQSDFDKVDDLIKRRTAIKRAVVLSNATTRIMVGQEEYTVAEVIELKQHGMEHKQAFVQAMASQMNRAKKTLMHNDSQELQDAADRFIAERYNDKDTRSEVVQKARSEYIADKSYELIDPLKLQEKIDAMNEEIATFLAKCDSALSVSNALTTIEIEY